MRSISRVVICTLMLFCLMSGLFQPHPVIAENSIPLTSLGVNYIQDFDTLSMTGESGILPSGWFLAETKTNKNNLYKANTGSSRGGDTYSYGSDGSTDRALGGIQDDNLLPLFGASFTNLTGEVIQSLDIKYTGEEWRYSVLTRLDKIIFEFSIDATSLTDGTWTRYSDLDFVTPYNGKVGARDGNVAENRQEKSSTLSNLSITSGKTFWIRWIDYNAYDADDGLAVDDFSLTPLGMDKAPSIVDITPSDGAEKVALDENISIAFSEPVNLSDGWLSLTCTISGQHSFQVNNGPQNFIINPREDFVNGDVCGITITTAKITDQDSNDPPDELDRDYSFNFSVLPVPDSPPIITSLSPSNSDVGVLLDASITVHFSEPVTVTPGWFSIDCSSSKNHPGSVEGGPSVYAILPLTPFDYDETCTVKINAIAVNDVDSEDPPDSMPSDFTATFSTQRTPDTAPYIVSSVPQNNANSVPVDKPVELTFNESVIIRSNGVSITCDHGNPYNWTLEGGPSVFQFYPDHFFNFEDHCTITVSAQKITDLDDNDPPDTMLSDQIISFETETDPSIPPEVSQTGPVNGEENIALDSNLSVTFSKDIWVTEPWAEINCSLSGVHTFFTSGNDRTKEIDPFENFLNNEICTLTVFASQIHSLGISAPLDGMTSDYQISFTTVPLIDLPPTIVETHPADQAVDVPVSGYLGMTFSKPVFLLPGWIEFSCSSSGEHRVSLDGGPTSFIFGAESDLDYLEVCTITLKADKIFSQIEDNPPHYMTADYTYSFTTQMTSDVFSYPTIVNDDNTFPNDGDYLYESINLLRIQFNEDVMHDGSNTAANNTANYCLIEAGENQIVETNSCDQLEGDDEFVPIDYAIYDVVRFQSSLTINHEGILPDGKYRLIVRGDHTIRNLIGVPLNNGANSVINFTIAAAEAVVIPTEVYNPPLSETVRETVKITAAVPMIPVTGFRPGMVTKLLPQLTTYDSLGSLWLEVPALSLKTSITGVPNESDNWDVTWLGDQVGWLEGSAYPTLEGNSVLTAHVWDAFNQPGPFYGLEKLRKGDQVIIHNGTKEYIYEVRNVLSVKPENGNAMMKHQDSSWLTLVTCQGYDENSGEYRKRILVRAALVEIR